MRLPDLRRQLILAMGLPAVTLSCGGASGTGAGSGNGNVIVIGNEVKVRPAGGACLVDEIPEALCGGAQTASGEAACHGTGSNLTSYGESEIYVTQGNYSGHDPAFAEFAYDEPRTERYRRLLTSQNLEFDLAPYCCFSRCTPLVTSSSMVLEVPAGYTYETRCMPAPPGGTSSPAAEAPSCPNAVTIAGEMRAFVSGGGDAQCCYAVLTPIQLIEEDRHYRGRPARVDGVPRLAAAAVERTWPTAALQPALAGVTPAIRAQLAAAWTETARMEHSSIASFADLSLQLLAVGAPPELVAAAHHAALDEIEHARIAFALATAYAGAPIGPARFPEATRQRGAGDLTALALETFVDGCIGETVAAVEARRAAAAAADPVIARALETIADDEARHSELAWAIVAWCVRARPALWPAIEAALARAQADDGGQTGEDDPDLGGHGVLSRAALCALRAEVVREVVTPCAGALGAALAA